MSTLREGLVLSLVTLALSARHLLSPKRTRERAYERRGVTKRCGQRPTTGPSQTPDRPAQQILGN